MRWLARRPRFFQWCLISTGRVPPRRGLKLGNLCSSLFHSKDLPAATVLFRATSFSQLLLPAFTAHRCFASGLINAPTPHRVPVSHLGSVCIHLQQFQVFTSCFNRPRRPCPIPQPQRSSLGATLRVRLRRSSRCSLARPTCSVTCWEGIKILPERQSLLLFATLSR